jgi:hypothetical protein
VHCYEPHGTQAFPAMAFSHMVATQNVKLPAGWYKPLTSHISQELNTDSNSKASTRLPNQTTTGSHMGVFETRTANASGSTKRPWGFLAIRQFWDFRVIGQAVGTSQTSQPVLDTATDNQKWPLPCLKACRGQGLSSFLLRVQCRSVRLAVGFWWDFGF